MGQYFYLTNIDKKQFIHPHKFGDGLKAVEFGSSGNGTMMGLALLLVDGNGRGGGDFPSNNPIIGSWAGDHIVIAGDYADEGKFTNDPKKNLHNLAEEEFQDISAEVLYALFNDKYILEDFEKATAPGQHFFGNPDTVKDLIKIKRCETKDLPLLLGKPSGKKDPAALQTDDGRRILEQEMKRRLGNEETGTG